MHQSKRKYLKKIFSTLLAFVLLMGSFTVPEFNATAASTIPNSNYRSAVSTSNSFMSSAKQTFYDLLNIKKSSGDEFFSENPTTNDSLSENSLSENSLSMNSLSENSLSMNSVSNNELLEDDALHPSDEDSMVEDVTMSEDIAETTEQEETLDQAGATTGYILTIDYNGGIDAEGKKSYQIQTEKGDELFKYLPDAEENIENENFLIPYEFTYKWVLTYTDTGAADNKEYRRSNSTKDINANMTLTAQWKETYRNYAINYNLADGYWPNANIVPATYTYATETITLPSPAKKGYIFKGFYKDAAYKVGPVTEIPKGSLGTIHLFAKWESAVPKEVPVINSVKNPSKGTVKVAFKSLNTISGYELTMSTKKNFKKNKNTMDLKATASSANLTNMPKGKTYYFKLRGYNYDSTGEKAYTAYSNVSKIKVKKGVSESKATATSGKLKSCSLKDSNNLVVKFKVSKRIKSSDDSYYLVCVDPNTNKYSKKIAASAKLKNPTFELPLSDSKGNTLIQGKFALAVKNGKKYKIISKAAFISNPEKAASYTGAFPTAASKKGLQGSTDLSLGIKHTFFNMDLNNVLNGDIPYTYNGKTYKFKDPWGHVISACNEAGLIVTGQVMLSYNNNTKYMILKSGRTPGKPFYAINVQEKKARETFEAAMNFLAERYGKEDCHLDNWIIGNEVNIHQAWYYAGNISREKFMQNYASTYRIMYYAVRSHSANSRVYICTDHTWSNRENDWGAKPFMDAFNKEIKSQQKKIQWNLAYHAYPSILTSAATWKDSHVSNKVDTEFVSPKNLDVLTNYVKKKFGSKTRIILSEQGFTSSSGKDVQAAAIAYTYYKAEFNPMIDAVIFRSDIDNESEGAQGLYMGLKDLSGKKKPAYDVFKYMDTPQAEKYTKQYLKTIGISSWKEVAPKYNLDRFK